MNIAAFIFLSLFLDEPSYLHLVKFLISSTISEKYEYIYAQAPYCHVLGACDL
jgi:hypothetical protein